MNTPLTDEGAPGWAIRLEAKMDVLLSKHEMRLEQHGAQLADHEVRLRDLQARPSVTPKGLVAAVTSAVGITTGVLVLIEQFAR